LEPSSQAKSIEESTIMRRSQLRKSSRQGFTLVELLVVITIIGMLMAMVFPALGSFMAKLDQTKCENNQGEIAKAIGRYESSKHRYPGYSMPILMTGQGGTQRQQVAKSWIVATLQMINEEQFDAIRKDLPTKPTELKMFNCPSNTRTGEQISYVANCGRKDSAGGGGNIPPDWKYNGVFMKHPVGKGATRPEYVNSSDIADGMQYTMLISENMQAQKWTQLEENEIGMIWEAAPESPSKDSMRINVDRHVEVTSGNYDYARPSSNHADGVVIAFCDGRTFFLSDRVEYGAVYCKLMTPNGAQCLEPGQSTRSADFFRQPFNDKLMTP
jgi:prepilin-type N-terminal cleavage/methylation domain-containing protein